MIKTVLIGIVSVITILIVIGIVLYLFGMIDLFISKEFTKKNLKDIFDVIDSGWEISKNVFVIILIWVGVIFVFWIIGSLILLFIH